MVKVPPATAGSNGRRNAATTASVRRGAGGSLADLIRLLEDVGTAKSGVEQQQARQTLATFVRDLTGTQRKRIRRGWSKLPYARRGDLLPAFFELGTFGGPAATLLREIRADEEAWVDSLPAPARVAERSLEEWTAILQRDGWTEEAARAAAADLSRGPDELTRAFHIKNGATAEEADALVAKFRRDEKWAAVVDAIHPTEFVADDRAKRGELRKVVPQIAALADRVALDLAALLVSSGGAAALLADDAGIPALSAAIARAILAGQQHAPAVFDGRARVVIRRPEDDAVWRWSDIVDAAGELADGIRHGASIDLNKLSCVARDVGGIAGEARALATELERERGRPPKAALDAAESLRARGLTWPQIATMLDRHGLHLDPHTADNIRKSVMARQRRRASDTPATK